MKKISIFLLCLIVWTSIVAARPMALIIPKPTLISPVDGKILSACQPITFQWTGSGRANAFQIQFTDGTQVTINKVSYTRTFNITTKTTIAWRVRAIDTRTNTSSVWTRVNNLILNPCGTGTNLPIPTQLTPQTGVVVDNCGAGVVYSWTVSPRAIGYVLDISGSNGYHNTLSLAATSASVVIPHTSAIIVRWRVMAIGANGASSGWTGLSNITYRGTCP